jgi:hypothetical protein
MRAPNDKKVPFREMREVVMRDPDFQIDVFLRALAVNFNPYYAWRALEVCLKNKKEIPDLLVAYLQQCIERMMSDRARNAGDLRDVLPWIFDFPMRAGPGKLLDPDRDPDDKLFFALKFAIKLQQGKKPSAAMASAAEEVLGLERAEKISEKTLKTWLVKVFDLEAWPAHATPDAWKRIARDHFSALDALIERRFRRIRR